MRKYSLAKTILKTRWLSEGIVEGAEGTISKCFEVEPLSTGLYEEAFEGPNSDVFFQKLSELLSRMPNLFSGQVILWPIA